MTLLQWSCYGQAARRRGVFVCSESLFCLWFVQSEFIIIFMVFNVWLVLFLFLSLVVNF
jgi:hypothetical protein